MEKNKTLKKSINYIDNQKLYEELKKYRDQMKECKLTNKPLPRLNNYIGLCVKQIAENLATIPKFSGYSFRDEMISDGIENVFMYIDNFDPDKYSNPFAYITKIVYYAFLRRILREKTHLYVKYKTAANYGIFDAMTNTEPGETTPFEMYDNLSTYIEEFEAKKAEKKAKKIKGVEKFMESE